MKNIISHAMQLNYTSDGLLEGLEMIFAETCNDLARAVLKGDPRNASFIIVLGGKVMYN